MRRPDHPVWVNRLDGHMALANSAALGAAGVNQDVADVKGGEIVRDAHGRPTGLLKDNAMTLVASKVPPPSDALKDGARCRDASCRSQGVTSVHNMGTWEDLEVFARARRDNRLSTRIYAAVPLDSWQRLQDAVAARTTAATAAAICGFALAR